MLRWPIRLKLIAGLSVVVGMMLILMGASIFGLHSFHMSYLTLVDQFRELGASADLIESVYGLHSPREGTAAEKAALRRQVVGARRADGLLPDLKKNTSQGSRVDSGAGELGLAFLIDDDLAAIRSELDMEEGPIETLLPGTSVLSSFIPRCCRPSSRPGE